MLPDRRAELREGIKPSPITNEDPKTQAAADLTLTLTKEHLPGLLAGHGLDGMEYTGDPAALAKLRGLLDNPRPSIPHRHTVSALPHRLR